MWKKGKEHDSLLIREKWLEFLSQIPPDAVVLYTDGALSPDRKKAATGIYIPALNVREAWILENKANIFSTELWGIIKALDTLYEQNVEQIFILTDSKAAVQIIHPIINVTHYFLSRVRLRRADD